MCGAGLHASVNCAAVGSAWGAVAGGLISTISGDNIFSGALNGAIDGFAFGAITGGVTGVTAAGYLHLNGKTRIIGSAQKALYYTRKNGIKVRGTFFHRMASNIQGGKMVLSGKYSQVALDEHLYDVGLVGRKMPDVIGIGKNGKPNLLVEVVSKSQSKQQMVIKCKLMTMLNPNTNYHTIQWAGKIGRWLI